MPETSGSSTTRSTGGKLIALTFDDGPCAYTKRLLDGLAQRGVKVTFFMAGQMAQYNPSLVKRAFDEGHQIASHTYDHPTLSTESNDEIAWQLGRTDEILDDAIGMDLKYLLRPPYGDWSDRVASQVGTPAIIWSIDSLDWVSLNSYEVRDEIVYNAFDGAIVLAHDIHSTTIDGALWAIDTLLSWGYEFVTVNELYRRRGVELYDGNRYYSCKPNGVDYGPVEVPEVTAEAVYGGYKLTMKAEAPCYYRVDGGQWTRYTGPMVLPTGGMVECCAAYHINGGRSDLVTMDLAGEPVQMPTVRGENGYIVIENPNEGTDVRYTTDGSEPTANSRRYTGPIKGYDGRLSLRVMGPGIGSETLTINVTKNGNAFLDVTQGDWYYRAVDRAVALGFFNGTAPYTFAPDLGLTRGMFVTVLYRLLQKEGVDVETGHTAAFTDVKAGTWYYEAVTWASANEVVLGYTDGSFAPDRTITREEMCVILCRVLKVLGCQVPEAELTFADANSIGHWAAEAVAAMNQLGFIQGMGQNVFAPKRTSTRAQAATVLLRLYDYLQTN